MDKIYDAPVEAVSEKHTKNPVTWAQLSTTRNRQYKDENGDPIRDSNGDYVYYKERVFFTIVPTESTLTRRPWLKAILGDSCVGKRVTLFMIGSTQEQEHYAFIHDHERNLIYANSKNKARFVEYVDFYKNATGAEVVLTDDLPTVIPTRTSTGRGAVDSLEAALEKAACTVVDF